MTNIAEQLLIWAANYEEGGGMSPAETAASIRDLLREVLGREAVIAGLTADLAATFDPPTPEAHVAAMLDAITAMEMAINSALGPHRDGRNRQLDPAALRTANTFIQSAGMWLRYSLQNTGAPPWFGPVERAPE